MIWLPQRRPPRTVPARPLLKISYVSRIQNVDERPRTANLITSKLFHRSTWASDFPHALANSICWAPSSVGRVWMRSPAGWPPSCHWSRKGACSWWLGDDVGFAHRSQVSRQFRSINDHLTNCRFWSYTHIVTNSSTRTRNSERPEGTSRTDPRRRCRALAALLQTGHDR